MASNMKACVHFSRSSTGCQYGAMCNFSHDLTSNMASGGVPAQVVVDPTLAITGGQHQRPCRYFRNGFCKEGSRCKNSHDQEIARRPQKEARNADTAQAAGRRKQDKRICKFFSSANGCRLGENCNLLHEVSSKVAVKPNVSLQEVEDSSSEASDTNEARSATVEATKKRAKKPTSAAAMRNASGNPSANRRRPCRFFNSSDGCHLGSKCRYSHDTPLTREDEEASDSEVDFSEIVFDASTRIRPDDKAEVRTRRPCRFFTSSSGCKDGDKCRYVHRAPVEQSTGYTPRSKSECKYFNSPSGCKDGENCRYTHEAPEGQATSNSSTRNRGECKYFNSSIGCKDGENCRYLHDVPEHQATIDTPRSKVVCKYFNSSTRCKDGRNCRYAHDLPAEETNHRASAVYTDEEPVVKALQKSPHPCKYFNSTDGCRLGDNCGYLHEVRAESDTGRSRTAKESVSTTPHLVVRGGSLESSFSDMTAEQQQDARNTEIEILRKRYPQVEEVARQKQGTAYLITFIPTDPDWPYDVRSLDIQIYFPVLYPKKMMDVAIPQQENLPETVRRCVGFSTVDWVTARFNSMYKKGRVERVFRPFLRWLDRDLQDIFTDALTHYKRELMAKAAGIEIIPARHLQARYQQQAGDGDVEDENEADDVDAASRDVVPASRDVVPASRDVVPTSRDVTYYVEEPESDGDGELSSQAKEAGNAESGELLKAYTPVAKGTEVRCRQLQLSDTVATLMAQSLAVRVRCERCRHTADVQAPSGRLNELACGKCSQPLWVQYRADLMHPFSSVLGYLDLEHCQPFDVVLLDCLFVSTCMQCNNDNKLGGIPPGQPKPDWCRTCHAKISIAMEGVQFRQLQPTTIEKTDNAFHVGSEKAVRNIHDPAIKEGRTLPDQGTCRHYKKSFRWLRFPCCGKTYPCDICHEQSEDHEFKFANRMICGFCCHEQMYSALKPCTACLNNLTSKSTEHWEGGRGCRDVIRMSRGDDKKYSNSNKTVSRKAAAKKPSSKKNTQIRHAAS